MGKFVTHEPVAAGIFCGTYNGSTSLSAAWTAQLGNSVGVLLLLCNRMESDFASQHIKMRKPYTSKDLDF